jgi:hypothetical protein
MRRHPEAILKWTFPSPEAHARVAHQWIAAPIVPRINGMDSPRMVYSQIIRICSCSRGYAPVRPKNWNVLIHRRLQVTALITASATLVLFGLPHGVLRGTEGNRRYRNGCQDCSKYATRFLPEKPLGRSRPVRPCEEKIGFCKFFGDGTGQSMKTHARLERVCLPNCAPRRLDQGLWDR